MMRLAPGLRDLQLRHRGPVLDEADPGYDTARTSFNALLDRRPSIIARAACKEDVVAAVAFAPEKGVGAALRGGGTPLGGDLQLEPRTLAEPASATAGSGSLHLIP